MSLKIRLGLPFQLTLNYACVFLLSIILILGTIYFLAVKKFMQFATAELLEDAHEFLFAYQNGGLSALKNAVQVELNLKGANNLLVKVWDQAGRVVFETDSRPWGNISTKFFPGIKQFVTSSGVRALGYSFRLGPYHVLILSSLQKEEKILKKVRLFLILGGFLGLFLSLYTGWLLAKRSCAHIKDITQAARRITQEEDFSQRIPVRGTGDELDQLALILNQMLDRIENLLNEMDRIIDNLAHDLRTPLTRIRMLAEDALTQKDLELVSSIQVEIMEECDRLIHLLNALLDISEAKSGILRLRKESVSLSDLFLELEELFLPVAESKGIDLQIYPLKINLLVDRFRFRQALANLLDNALKFTKQGSVCLSASLEEDKLIIVIEDTGIGIPNGDLDKIFKKFYRLDQSRKTPGKGVGLSLARAYIEAHGGKIVVKSKVGKGSVFYIILPYEQDKYEQDKF